MADYIVSCVIAQTSWGNMALGAVSKFTTLSPSKASSVVIKFTTYATMNLFSGGTAALTNAGGAVSNNLLPFYIQCQKYVAKKQAKGMNETGLYNNVYRLSTQFFTKNRIQMIMQRAKTKATASKWTGIVSASYFGSFFNFGLYTLK